MSVAPPRKSAPLREQRLFPFSRHPSQNPVRLLTRTDTLMMTTMVHQPEVVKDTKHSETRVRQLGASGHIARGMLVHKLSHAPTANLGLRRIHFYKYLLKHKHAANSTSCPTPLRSWLLLMSPYRRIML
eukprot:223629-Amphidinium_carterae.1